MRDLREREEGGREGIGEVGGRLGPPAWGRGVGGKGGRRMANPLGNRL